MKIAFSIVLVSMLAFLPALNAVEGFLLPTADAAGLVPCGKPCASYDSSGKCVETFGSQNPADPSYIPLWEAQPCTFCHFLQLGQNVMNFFLMIVFPLAILMLVYGGILIMFSAGSPSRVSRGKEIITAAIVGVLIALLAWLFIDITIRVLAGSKQLGGLDANWYEIGVNLRCR